MILDGPCTYTGKDMACLRRAGVYIVRPSVHWWKTCKWPQPTIASGDVSNTLVYFVPKAGAADVKPGHYTNYCQRRTRSRGARTTTRSV